MRLVRHRHPRALARVGFKPVQRRLTAGVTPIGDVSWREATTVAGRVRSVRVQPWGGAPTLDCTLVDETGGLAVVFLGRREVAGIRPGTRLLVRGMVGAHDGRLAILNPDYEFLAAPTT
ncbi:MAG TPA: OB-fold nucleic acid binding domain-containing protein [Acidimicrobiales bacterium]|nr:OB-fold nucleic acid binding domain-containing protein [Acidimicrobiales bacterium]